MLLPGLPLEGAIQGCHLFAITNKVIVGQLTWSHLTREITQMVIEHLRDSHVGFYRMAYDTKVVRWLCP